jgi:hypothetical protein
VYGSVLALPILRRPAQSRLQRISDGGETNFSTAPRWSGSSPNSTFALVLL